MTLSARLRDRAEPFWERELAHPFVQGLGDGTLQEEKFKVWLRQDYLFLIEYGRVLGLAVARAEDLETMGRFADLLRATLRDEMDLHRRYAAKFGLTADDLEAAKPAPATRAYTDFLVRVGYEGPLAAMVAALLPCAWGYAEIASKLAARDVTPADDRYQEWIRTYSSPEFVACGEWLRELLDDLSDSLSGADQKRLAEIFLTASEHELRFWDMADRMEEE
ncbi:MAG TPA: thiaminase II [Candidatus Polarisedimenticolia bacterium]|nr:thiaminase II [Candidatus Polarisedimenticolia bacterium]